MYCIYPIVDSIRNKLQLQLQLHTHSSVFSCHNYSCR